MCRTRGDWFCLSPAEQFAIETRDDLGLVLFARHFNESLSRAAVLAPSASPRLADDLRVDDLHLRFRHQLGQVLLKLIIR